MSKEFWLHKFGRNSDVDAAEDVWDYGGNYAFPAVAFETAVVGGLSDMVSSNGVHSVRVEGLNAAGQEIFDVATLNAVTPVVLSNSYYRVNRAYVLTTGGVEVNSYDIRVTHTGSTVPLAQISAQQGQILQAVYTLPVNVSAHLLHLYADAALVASKIDVAGSIKFETREPGKSWRVRATANIGNSAPVDRRFYTTAQAIKPLSDVRVRVTAVNTANVFVNAGFELAGHRIN